MRCYELLKPLCNQFLAQWNLEIPHQHLKSWTETLPETQINSSLTGDCVLLHILLTTKNKLQIEQTGSAHSVY